MHFLVAHASAMSGAQMLAQSDLPGGLVIHLGCGDGSLTTELTDGSRFVVHGLTTDAGKVSSVRSAIAQKNLRGIVTVEQAYRLDPLPYADNLANILVVDFDELGNSAPREDEIRRVCAPFGTIFRKKGGSWTHENLPLTPGMDDWGQVHHGPDRTDVSSDQFAGPPTSLQWIGHYGQARRSVAGWTMLMKDGRFYYAREANSKGESHGIFARDVFSGVMLWQRESGINLKQTKTLVAENDMLFTPLNAGEPVVALDGRTGEIKVRYSDAQGVNPLPDRASFYGEISTVYAKNTLYVCNQRKLYSLDPVSGSVNWEFQYADTLYLHFPTVDTVNNRLFVWASTQSSNTNVGDHGSRGAGGGVALVALNGDDGSLLWDTPTPSQVQKLVYSPSQGLFAYYWLYGSRKSGHVSIYNPDNGDALFQRGYSEDEGLQKHGNTWDIPLPDGTKIGVSMAARTLLVYDDFFAMMQNTNKLGMYKFTNGGIEPQGGSFSDIKILCQHQVGTPNYVFSGHGGIHDFSGRTSHVSAMLGHCGTSNFVAYGMTYAGEAACQCYAVLQGWRAMATRPLMPPVADADRLHRGTGLSKMNALAKVQICGDNCYGFETGVLHPQQNSGNPLRDDWVSNDKFPGKIIENNGLEINVHEHTISGSGWTFTAGGRISSSPVIHKGYCVFGSHDGWVYCINPINGELVWWFLAAHNYEKRVAYSQVESAWPVFGVAVDGDRVYATAGRHPDFDGGVLGWALSINDGSIVWKNRIARWPNMGRKGVDNSFKAYNNANSNVINEAPRIENGILYPSKNVYSAGKTGFLLSNGELHGSGEYYTDKDLPPNWGEIKNVAVSRKPSAHAPNPFAQNLPVRLGIGHFYLPDDGFAHVSLHDAMGRRLAVFFQGRCSKGTTRFNVAMQNHPAGVYFLRLQSQYGSTSKKLLAF